VLTRAYRDIVDIWNYTATDNPAAADEQEGRFFAAIRLLGEQPGLGHQRPDVSDPRYRFWRVGAYQIAYRVRGKQLTVCRVVHSARDFRKLF
jgi:plasmid stabilization system protein ParE